MKQYAQLSVFACFSFVNNYDAQKMTQRLNESFYKAAEEARAEEMRKKIKKEMIVTLNT